MLQEPNNFQDKEIDLSKISQKLGSVTSGISKSFYDFFFFMMRNWIIVSVLFIIGAGLGIYMDRKNKVYNHEMMVIPNFSSTDYLYSKVELLSAKIKEGDTLFLKSIGFKKPKKLINIEIEPINDVYEFVNQKETNFELLKLMAEDGDINKIIEETPTSKNYGRHKIIFTTKDRITDNTVVATLQKFLNDSEYYLRMQSETVSNLEIKMITNDSIIKQIDNVVETFAKSSGGSKANNLIYYNENTQLHELIKSKEALINEQAYLRIVKINYSDIVKDSSITLNIRSKKGTIGKMKFILPLLFIFLFCMVTLFGRGLKKQIQSRKA